LLTDEEVAEQYLTDNGLAGEPLKFNSVKELLVFLASLPRAIDHVTIDPGIGKPNIIAKYHVIRRLKEMFNC
jgi:hypothetical protein